MKRIIFFCSFLSLLIIPKPAMAMHIMEGFLPIYWSLLWTFISLPFFIYGVYSISKSLSDNPELKLLLGVSGAFAFVLSALKIPSISGSSSHPTGVGLGSILFGPSAMTVIGTIVLTFQALLLAHGGITTLGANTFSMAVAGPFVAYYIFVFSQKFKLSKRAGIFLAAFFGNMTTYVVTSLQLAFAFPAENGGILESLLKFSSVFAFTQVPLAVSEGILTVIVFNFLSVYSVKELSLLKNFKINS